MTGYQITVVFLILTVLSYGSAVNYCNLCSNHVACGNDGKFLSSCPKDANIVTLSGANIQTLVNMHNNVRNLLATGRVPGYKSASKMNELKWDPELAFLSELNVKQCEMKHDKCRATEKYQNAGQNIYYSATTGAPGDINADLAKAVNMWFDEYKLASQSDTDNCCGGSKFSKIGHFLQVAQDQAVAVGCAAARYTKNGWKTTLVTCNYSHGNILSRQVYAGGSPASACPKGRNTVLNGLCNS